MRLQGSQRTDEDEELDMRFYRKMPLEISGKTVRKSIPLDVSKGENGGIAYALESTGGKLRGGIGANAVSYTHLVRINPYLPHMPRAAAGRIQAAPGKAVLGIFS